MALCKASFQLFGPSGSGKTPLIGEFAEWLCRTTGGKYNKATKQIEGGDRTLLYTNDGGGWNSIQEKVDLKIVHPVDLTTRPRPFEWLNAVTRGLLPDANGKWVAREKVLPGVKIGCLAFEGLTAFGNALMLNMAEAAGEGISIGGEKTFAFKQGDGDTITKVGTNNRVHYNLAQSEIARRVTASQANSGLYIIWTALTRMAGDDDSLGTVVGPQVVGKALTPEVPRWFGYSFRLAKIVPDMENQDGKVIRRLYLDEHTDMAAGGASITSNNRRPLDSDPLPLYIEPASLVKAYELIRKAESQATEKTVARFPTV